MWYSLARAALFQLEPETAHHVALGSLRWAERMGLLQRWPQPPSHPVSILGLTFPNPVGLSAGLDKNGDYIDALAALGFGFIEIGTTTPRPQPGNAQPRMFRLPAAHAIINRLGFNNDGVDALVRNVQRAKFAGILGINIGKNADTPVEQAADDYLICLEKVYAYASYITVNISSPNTQGLRSLQNEAALSQLLAVLKARQLELAEQHGKYVPLLVKVAPDLSLLDVESMAAVFIAQGIDGVIATNTTIERQAVAGLQFADEAGGLSGRPVRESATRVLREFHTALNSKLPVIGVGGIANADSAAEKIAAGASLLQIYTGFIYEGPDVITQAVIGASRALKRRQTVDASVGASS
ncbi:dihydroorotate oxidase A [Paraperlucidibaca baekdonensis]|uniref:Dihydroorotate dehydrogenase (quinone) n=1 Tax=Paraperlucidibaca baekdonensis TaxID=748120 RepID=A0A3E0H1D7_9GAMM|nr:quinone-dependent dihydroorotate dehydrogenase [Paraperlucidibaca baekdonensis]REH36922.1 dihydroorotate oxidase A [Paraperlucidibaca baekdonensis]